MADLPIGVVIRMYRKRAKLSQNELADRIGVMRTYISKVENAKCMPTVDSVTRLAEGLGTNGWRILRRAERARAKLEESEMHHGPVDACTLPEAGVAS